MSFLTKESKSQTNMLNKSGPGIEPWETPNNIPSQELHDEFILVLCSLSERKLCINFDVDKLKPYPFNFAIIRSCGRQSKALRRSVRRALNVLPLSIHFCPFFYHG